MIKRVHRFLNQFGVFTPLLRFLAYLKNDYFKESFEDALIKRMPKGWQNMKIVDLGCGPCYKERDTRVLGVDIMCVDIYKPYLQICRTMGFETIHADIRKIKNYFSYKSVDIIWLLDVIEHVEKSEALKLLETVEKIAKKQIIIFAPSGEVPQEESDGNVYQRHISTWSIREFETKGYKCEMLVKYHRDIRHQTKELSKSPVPISADAIWAIKNYD